jgi:hypothetical protein
MFFNHFLKRRIKIIFIAVVGVVRNYVEKALKALKKLDIYMRVKCGKKRLVLHLCVLRISFHKDVTLISVETGCAVAKICVVIYVMVNRLN